MTEARPSWVAVLGGPGWAYPFVLLTAGVSNNRYVHEMKWRTIATILPLHNSAQFPPSLMHARARLPTFSTLAPHARFYQNPFFLKHPRPRTFRSA